MLKHAKKWGYLKANPAEDIENLRAEKKEMAFLKPDEIVKLLYASPEPHRTMFLTAILTGMRCGEMLSLQWPDIDWYRNVIRVQRSLYWMRKEELDPTASKQEPLWRFSTPKSNYSIRTITMSPVLRAALDRHRLRATQNPHDLVFCNSKGNPFEAPNMVRRYFLPALKRAGLPRIRFHDLRHTYTTLLIAQGENVKLIQSQLGHASIQTTMDRYGHLLPEPQREVGQRLDVTVFGPDGSFVTNHLLLPADDARLQDPSRIPPLASTLSNGH
jgi:integrase